MKNIVYLIMTGLVCIALLLLMDFGVFKMIRYKLESKKGGQISDDPTEDDDVQKEKQNIRSKSKEELKMSTMALKDVSKYYKKFLAVKHLCLQTNTRECFGLLGVNGAGKTTTFKMLTGLELITHGDIYINGLNLKTNLKNVYKVMGYCPQFDALLDNLTGRETLIIFGLLRGLKYQEAKFQAIKWSKDLDFYKHLDKEVRMYSGGNKRKLSTAVAMLGDPQIIFLDEPTTGMDPGTKRNVWDTINKLRDDGKCIILTSHSMEECEALCTRLAIMVNGSFKCIGSTQHLKNKFSQGYTLSIKIKKSDEEQHLSQDINYIESFVHSKFPSAQLRENYQELLVYYIPDKDIPCSAMFGIMEKAKTQFYIEDYSIGQCSLEQVRINLLYSISLVLTMSKMTP